ncbi:hypothetical protein A1O3_10082 [Capronia epimyces CBS 606.96]|uniref:Uncharacterized protein n=1 Tax=Capronia epimyces CBS 606.96 TaxID=1182542 RepID=W9XHW3_9EURO|nr:uncharacterized protein A1O3_10082 [Capronia epimyces CBS 606.96]EXJ76925.1 hypothetical protein A1O3_10082 [Capronia epimyces CBS 606.96]
MDPSNPFDFPFDGKQDNSVLLCDSKPDEPDPETIPTLWPDDEFPAGIVADPDPNKGAIQDPNDPSSSAHPTDGDANTEQQYLNPEIGSWPDVQDPALDQPGDETTFTEGNPSGVYGHANFHTIEFPDFEEQIEWRGQPIGLPTDTAGYANPFPQFDTSIDPNIEGMAIQGGQATSLLTNNAFNELALIGPGPAIAEFESPGGLQPASGQDDMRYPNDFMNQWVSFAPDLSANDNANTLPLEYGVENEETVEGALPSRAIYQGQDVPLASTYSTSLPNPTIQYPLAPSSIIPVQGNPAQDSPQAPLASSGAGPGIAQGAGPGTAQGAGPGTAQGSGTDGRRRAFSNNPRLPRVRDVMPRSAPHQRLSTNLVPSQQAITLGRGRNSGLNQLALFGLDDVPRTIYPLEVHRGRMGRASSSQYPAADTILPARLSLQEICKQYPNHVWGSLLRIFIAEGWTAEQIWQELPEDYRHNEATTRPWNYIQAAFGRETDQMTKEETGQKRVPAKRKKDDGDDDLPPLPLPTTRQLGLPPLPSGPAIPVVPSLMNPVLAPQSVTASAPIPTAFAAPVPMAMHMPAPAMQHQEDSMTVQQLQQNVTQQRDRIMEILLQIERMRTQSTSENVTVQATVIEYRNRQDRWIQSVAARFGHLAPGEDLGSLNIVDLIRRVFEIQNPNFSATETFLSYQARTTWFAWRQYLRLVTLWARDYEQMRDEMVQLAHEIYG